MSPFYLVQIVHSMDDFVVKLFERQDEAKTFIKALLAEPKLLQEWDRKIQDIFQIYASTPCGMRLVFFDSVGVVCDSQYWELGRESEINEGGR